MRALANKDAAAFFMCGVSGNGPAFDGELLVGVDSAAIAVRGVFHDGAVLDRQVACTAAIVVVEDATALLRGIVLGDAAVFERRRAEALNATTFFARCSVVGYIDPIGSKARRARDLDSTAIVGRHVAGKRASGHVDGAVVQVDARTPIGGGVVFDDRVGDRKLLALRVQAQATANAIRDVVGNRAIRDGRIFPQVHV